MSGKTLAKAVAILDCFTQSEPAWTATALSKRLGMPVTTLHGLLGALVSMDFLVQSKQSKEYRLGIRYLEMGLLHANNSELNNIAQGVMRDLVFGTNLLGLNILYKGWMYNSMTVLPLKNTSSFKFVGPKLPAHLTTGGLVIMANLPEADIDRYFEMDWAGTGMPQPDPIDEFKKQLAAIRNKGYAVGQSLVSFAQQSTIGAPIFGRNRCILAALVLLGTEKPFSPANVAEYGKRLSLAASDISSRCGHLEPMHSLI